MYEGYSESRDRGDIVSTILIIDDDTDSQDVLAEALKLHHSDTDIRVVNGGPEALEILPYLPDICMIVIDLAMPGMDGWSLLEAIRARPDYHDIPLVAITAYGSPRVARQAEDAGFNAYFDKPIDIYNFGRQLDAIQPG